MSDCRRRRTLIGLVPFKRWRDALQARHAAGCSLCQEGLADIREARSVTWSKEDFEGRADLWPGFDEALRRPEASAPPRSAVRWRWAAVSAAAAGLAVAGLILLDFEKKNGQALPQGLKMIIESSMIYNELAQVFIFQTRDENTTFVWVEKRPEGEQP